MTWVYDVCSANLTLFVSLAFPEYLACFQLTEKACIPSHFNATRALNYWESANEHGR